MVWAERGHSRIIALDGDLKLDLSFVKDGDELLVGHWAAYKPLDLLVCEMQLKLYHPASKHFRCLRTLHETLS